MTGAMDRSERVLVKYPLFKTAIARIQACFDSHDATAEPDCCPIVGESGSGKTTIISYFASLHPRIDHKAGLEVPVLVAKVPARPTVKSFAETLLYQLGDPLWLRGNTVNESIRLRELLKRCCVRLLALDGFLTPNSRAAPVVVTKGFVAGNSSMRIGVFVALPANALRR